MKKAPLLALIAAPLLLGGCVSAAKTVVTAPFKAAGKVADWSTTSQEEADRNLGRKYRERDAKLGQLQRDVQKADRRCQDGDRRQCERAELLRHEMDALVSAPLR